MSLFEDLKRNATDVANKAVKKTEELTNITKLNFSLKSNESKLSGVFEDIGRMFYEAERKGVDYTSDIASAVMKADKLAADIEKLKSDIAKLRKVTICPGCGEEISDDALFCPKCGTKQEKPVEPEPEEECCCGCEETESCCCESEEPCCCEEETEEKSDCGCCCGDAPVENTEEAPEVKSDDEVNE